MLLACLITVVGTGNMPLTSVEALEPRYIFHDAPLLALSDSEFELTVLISPFASTSFNHAIGSVVGWKLNASQMDNLQWQIGNATARGMKARYSDTPGVAGGGEGGCVEDAFGCRSGVVECG